MLITVFTASKSFYFLFTTFQTVHRNPLKSQLRSVAKFKEEKEDDDEVVMSDTAICAYFKY